MEYSQCSAQKRNAFAVSTRRNSFRLIFRFGKVSNSSWTPLKRNPRMNLITMSAAVQSQNPHSLYIIQPLFQHQTVDHALFVCPTFLIGRDDLTNHLYRRGYIDSGKRLCFGHHFKCIHIFLKCSKRIRFICNLHMKIRSLIVYKKPLLRRFGIYMHRKTTPVLWRL